MFLSFVVPVYNASKYLEECLLSLISQDISPDEFEIICVDDGSTDDSKLILEDYRKRYSNVVVCYQENTGVSSARNRGIKEAKGDYIWFVDSDDFISHNILNQLKSIALTNYADRITIESYSFKNKLDIDEQQRFYQNSLNPNVPYKLVMATRTLYKREYLLKNNIGFLEGVHYGEDGVFNYQSLIHNPITADSNILGYFYRIHNQSVTNIDEKLRTKKSLEGTSAVFRILVDDYNNKVCVKETRRMLLYWMYATLNSYAVLDDDCFCDTFAWDYELKNIPIFDFELRKLNKFICKLSETRNYQSLLSFNEKQLKKASFLKKKDESKKKIISYVKHPRRLLRKMFKL